MTKAALGARGLSVAVLGLGLMLIRCGSNSSEGKHAAGESGAAGAGGDGPGGANQAGTSAAGARFAGAAGTLSESAGEGGAAAAGAGGDEAGAAGAATEATLGYVFRRQSLPLSASKYALDLDGDHQADNAYGRLLGVLSGYGFAVQSAADIETAAGRGLSLLQLNLPDSNVLNSTSVRLELARAQELGQPNFDGTGSFQIDGAAPSAALLGVIGAGTLKSAPVALGEQPQQARLRLQFGIAVDVPVQLLSVSCHVAANWLTLGQLNGAILASDLDAILPPALAAGFNQRCGGAAAQSESCMAYLAVFDTNQDLSVSADEVRASSIVQGVLAPDVKLFDAQGKFAPDGSATQKDSFSVGIGFLAVSADVTPSLVAR